LIAAAFAAHALVCRCPLKFVRVSGAFVGFILLKKKFMVKLMGVGQNSAELMLKDISKCWCFVARD